MRARSIPSFDELERAWIADPEWFWSEVERDLGIVWFEPPARVRDVTPGKPWERWFPAGTTNVTATCVDRHPSSALAVVWEGEEGIVRRLDYGELSELVSRIAGGLVASGVASGDRVGLYLPLAPEAVACLYACAKVGAIAVPMFSGFGVAPIATRLQQARVKVLITADGSMRRGREIDMRWIAEEAAAAAPSVERVVVWPRLRDGNWDAFLDAEPVRDCVPVDSSHPFLLAYTSGTTGKPKGAVHTHGGFPLKAASETMFHLDQRTGESICWLTDPGWIMAPLTALGAGVTGNTVFLYDGAPDYPAPRRVADMLRRHEVAILGISPTFIRALMRHDDHGFDRPTPSLRVLGSTGEAWNDSAWWWYFEHVGKRRCPIINIAGGTEAGSFLGAVPVRPLKPSSFNSVCVGIDADIFGVDGQPVAAGDVGELVVKQSWPGRTNGFWDDTERYLESYWSRWPDVWVHGDWASRDADGSWWLHGRSDDTMNIAGKRLGPSDVESVLCSHPLVVDAAAVGLPDEQKGEVLRCYVVTRSRSARLADELATFVADALGRAFRPDRVEIVSALPRTRNGKILRRAIRAAATGSDAGDLSSLENPQAVEEIALGARP
jgi:acetyl-CoA synthetase